MDDWLSRMAAEQTDFEARMLAEHKCIGCGAKVDPYGPRKDGTWFWPRHCKACGRAHFHPDLVKQSSGPHRASMHAELARRTGYSACQAGGPEMNTTTEES